MYEIELVSLAPHGKNWDLSQLAYLQYVRSGILNFVAGDENGEKHEIARVYHQNVTQFATELAELLDIDTPDAILMTPSTRTFNEPYFAAIENRYPTALNLTSSFRRKWNVKSGLATSWKQVLEDTIYEGDERLNKINSLVVVDDILESGKTVASLIFRMREQGMNESIRITVACPLWVDVGDKK